MNNKIRNRLVDPDRRFPSVMIAPTLIILILLTVYPLIFTLVYSFTNYNYLKGTSDFIGLENYQKLLNNTYFIQAVLNTIKFTLIAVVIELIFGTAVAVFVNGMKRGQKIMRTLILIPYLLPAVTVSLTWKIMLSSNYGIINQVLEALHLPVYNWFNDVKSAFGTVLVIDVWQNIPFVFLLLYASLQSVPVDQYEAADVDGANKWHKFVYITVPSIKSGIFLCALLRTIDTFRLFEKVNVLTQGGPANTTATITQFLYNYGIKNLKFGFGSAGSIVMTLLVLLLSGAYIKRAMK